MMKQCPRCGRWFRDDDTREGYVEHAWTEK